MTLLKIKNSINQNSNKSYKVIGFDLGSRTSKAILFANGNIYSAITTTGIYVEKSVNNLIQSVLQESGITLLDIKLCNYYRLWQYIN